MVPPPPKGAPAAVQEPVLSIFQGNYIQRSKFNFPGLHKGGHSREYILSTQENPGFRLFGHISIGAPQRRGEAPGASIIITILTWSRFSEKKHAAAPEGRPGGGSGTCPVDFPGKSSDYFRRDPGFRLFGYIFIKVAAAAGRSPGSV